MLSWILTNNFFYIPLHQSDSNKRQNAKGKSNNRYRGINMDEYIEIVEKFKDLEGKKKSLAEVSKEYGFKSEKTLKENNNNESRYEVFKASKKMGEYTLIIKIETKDSYRSFKDDKEPYFNSLELWNADSLVRSESYTYFK
jgi:hypothetical protein